jgi:hypothetical protein
MTDRSGIEIDYCPECRGVWLDRGELDKIIERSIPPSRPVQDDRDVFTRVQRDDYRHKRKPKSLLGEIFDF